MPLRSQKNTLSTTRMPDTMPMMHAPMESTKAQGAVMATRPASMPLQSMDGSGFLVLNHHMYKQVAIAAVADASMVFVAATLIRRSPPASELPALNENQQNARMNVPSRGPSSHAKMSAMTPPCMCTTELPA